MYIKTLFISFLRKDEFWVYVCRNNLNKNKMKTYRLNAKSLSTPNVPAMVRPCSCFCELPAPARTDKRTKGQKQEKERHP